ncbi:hypothetical protein CLS_16140 [[Clostridium] cf. saccharolyticum K10]|nr:hypothetical protein CLS_16140 [[Clostridium] cf. saccharolyticum K10]
MCHKKYLLNVLFLCLYLILPCIRHEGKLLLDEESSF